MEGLMTGRWQVVGPSGILKPEPCVLPDLSATRRCDLGGLPPEVTEMLTS